MYRARCVLFFQAIISPSLNDCLVSIGHFGCDCRISVFDVLVIKRGAVHKALLYLNKAIGAKTCQ